MLYDEYVVAVEAANQSGAIEKILLSQLQMEEEASRMHPTFWSAYRVEQYETLLGHTPNVLPITARVGQAVFPSCVTSELCLLYRVVLTQNTVGRNRILSPLITEQDYVLDLLNQSVSGNKAHVDLSIVQQN